MSLSVWGVKWLTELWLTENLGIYSHALITSIISIIIGVFVYLGIGLRLPFVKKILERYKKSAS